MSKHNSLYFSMQRWNESQDAWLCRTAPAYEHRNQSAGLSGKPNKQGVWDCMEGEKHKLTMAGGPVLPSKRGQNAMGLILFAKTGMVAVVCVNV